MMIWNVLTVAPQRERKVAAEIRAGLGLQVCVPCLQKHRKSRGKNNRPVLVPYLVPLMPRYVFVGAKNVLPVYDLMALEYVNGFVTFGGKIATLRDAEVDHIRRLAKDVKIDTKSGYQVGDAITITDGPFKSFPALIQEIRGGDVRVDVELFGRTAEHWRRADQIEKAHAA